MPDATNVPVMHLDRAIVAALVRGELEGHFWYYSAHTGWLRIELFDRAPGSAPPNVAAVEVGGGDVHITFNDAFGGEPPTAYVVTPDQVRQIVRDELATIGIVLLPGDRTQAQAPVRDVTPVLVTIDGTPIAELTMNQGLDAGLAGSR